MVRAGLERFPECGFPESGEVYKNYPILPIGLRDVLVLSGFFWPFLTWVGAVSWLFILGEYGSPDLMLNQVEVLGRC